MIDELDRKILEILQQDNTLSLDELTKKVNSSRTPVWNRIRKLKERGVIKSEVALLDPSAIGLNACFFVLIKTSEHAKEWQQLFLKTLKKRPEILEAHRLAGDIDYLLKVRVKDPTHFDNFYQSLVSDISIYNVTSLLSMQEIISRTQLPLEPEQ